MRISFSNSKAAWAAVTILEQYGFTALQEGNVVTTDCPTLLAAPAIERSIGLELVEAIDLTIHRPPAAPFNDNGRPQAAAS
jgi:hypothetical protein